MYRAWAASPALKFVSSETAGTPVLARQVLKRSSQGPLAARVVAMWTLDVATPGRAGRAAITAVPRIEMARRRPAGDLRAAASVAKTCFEPVATPSTTSQARTILRLATVQSLWRTTPWSPASTGRRIQTIIGVSHNAAAAQNQSLARCVRYGAASTAASATGTVTLAEEVKSSKLAGLRKAM